MTQGLGSRSCWEYACLATAQGVASSCNRRTRMDQGKEQQQLCHAVAAAAALRLLPCSCAAEVVRANVKLGSLRDNPFLYWCRYYQVPRRLIDMAEEQVGVQLLGVACVGGTRVFQQVSSAVTSWTHAAESRYKRSVVADPVWCDMNSTVLYCLY